MLVLIMGKNTGFNNGKKAGAFGGFNNGKNAVLKNGQNASVMGEFNFGKNGDSHVGQNLSGNVGRNIGLMGYAASCALKARARWETRRSASWRLIRWGFPVRGLPLRAFGGLLDSLRRVNRLLVVMVIVIEIVKVIEIAINDNKQYLIVTVIEMVIVMVKESDSESDSDSDEDSDRKVRRRPRRGK
jgi:hypothetical protein